MPAPRDQLIVALDLPTGSAAKAVVSKLGQAVSTFKVGKQLFVAEGPAMVRDLIRAGYGVFLDLKFHDIPNTVAQAVASAASLGVSMLTVHASGGSNMLRAAVQAASQSAKPPLVLAVTVLTSLSDRDLQEVGVSGRTLDQVLRLASLAQASGCGGVIASPNEVRELRRELGGGFAIVTPGIRAAGAVPGDQARVATAVEAISAGASHIVVGRPITEAPNPKAAAEALLDEIGSAVARR